MNLRDRQKLGVGGGRQSVHNQIIRGERLRVIADERAAIEARNLAFAGLQMQEQLQACQECERTRIAADLHDSIGSSLSAIKFGLEDAIKRIQADAPHVTLEPLTKIASELKSSIDEVRRIAMNLRPSILDDLGIVATIGWFCRELERCRGNVRVVKEVSAPEAGIPNSLKTAIFRIMQEATNNTLKHGDADLIRITLSQDDGEIRLMVEDNGKGFEMAELRSKNDYRRHFGIASMRQRVKCSGGSLVIKTSPGAGTQVIATWPSTKV
jgi:signal transduction histidine kinase